MAFRDGSRLCHWGPILALTVIGTISICTIRCVLQWWPVHTIGGFINLFIFIFWHILVLYNFFNATFIGPGKVQFKWKPNKQEDTEFLQYCALCEGYKPPRSHHCRKCKRCVMKMDHHCPWINNCVGHQNHGSFTLFLFFAPIGCIHALAILIPSMYRAIHRRYYILYGTGTEPLVFMTLNGFIASLFGAALALGVTIAVGILFIIQSYYMYHGIPEDQLVHLTLYGFVGCMFAVGLAFGVVVAVGGLFYVQIREILKNETGIETWIKDKAEYRDRENDEPMFVFPYNLGKWRNLRMVFHWTPRPELNGIWWPVVEGCNQFALTIEQIKQKKEKKDRSQVYDIVEDYSGRLIPCTKGIRVACCLPCTDEPRIVLKHGEKVRVSRWKKHWLYGDMLLCNNQAKDVKRVRGWFPRRCAQESASQNDVTKDDLAMGDVMANNLENKDNQSKKKD